MGMLTLAKIARASLEYPLYLPSAGALVVVTSVFWRQLISVTKFLALMASGGKTSACFSSGILFILVIFDPLIPLGVISLRCWSYPGLPNAKVVCVQERFWDVLNMTPSGLMFSRKVNAGFLSFFVWKTTSVILFYTCANKCGFVDYSWCL